jgi:hypothetical protein
VAAAPSRRRTGEVQPQPSPEVPPLPGARTLSAAVVVRPPSWRGVRALATLGLALVVPGTKEYWTLTYETPDGQTFSQKIYVERAQRLAADRPCAGRSG